MADSNDLVGRRIDVDERTPVRRQIQAAARELLGLSMVACETGSERERDVRGGSHGERWREGEQPAM